MNAKEAIMTRRSVRKFLDEQISDELISELLSAAQSAPSACGRYPIVFYVITNKDILKRLEESGRFTAIASPLAIVVAGDSKKFLPRSYADYWIHDAAAASENILIMATSLGLGSCWCGVHTQTSVTENVRSILDLPSDIIPFSIIRIGYSAEAKEPRTVFNEDRVTFIK